MPSLKTFSVKMLGFATTAVLALGLNVSPATAVETSTTINGVVYTMGRAGAAYASGFTSDLPTTVSIESSVTIGDNSYAVTSIGSYAFFQAKQMATLNLPKSLLTIGESAFAYTPLKSVTIPNTLTVLDSFAFFQANSLSSVTFLGDRPAMGSRVFEGETPTVYHYSRYRSESVAFGFTSPTWLGLPTVAVGEPLTLTPTPIIWGTAKVGKVLTSKPGTWDAGVKLTYEWNRSGAAIKGATKATYKLVKADAGKKLTVSVTATKPGFTGATKTSVATGKVKR